MGIEGRFFVSTQRSYFLFGPRGVGKSTLVKALYQDAILGQTLETLVAQH